MNDLCKYSTLLSILISTTALFNSCKKENTTPDPCANLVEGYVVGFNQCWMGKGFIVTTISPADTLETFNLPDSLYHFPTDARSDIYRNYINDFLFPTDYKNKFPVSFSFEVLPESDRQHVICSDQFIGHYTIAVKKQIRIKCATK